MKFTFGRKFKTLDALPVDTLPEFAVITGLNGAGKTLFFQALAEGCIAVEGVPRNAIRHLDWANFVPRDEEGYASQVLAQEAHELWKFLTDARSTIRNGQHPLIKAEEFDAALAQFDRANSRESTVAGVNQLNAIFHRVGGPDHQRKELLDIARRRNLPAFALQEEDFEQFPRLLRAIDPFAGSLNRLFASYIRAAAKRERTILHGTSPETSARDILREVRASLGAPPWEIINEFMLNAGLDVEVDEPPLNPQQVTQLRLKHRSNGADLRFYDLSSGERILASLSLCLFALEAPTRSPGGLDSEASNENIGMPALLLLDEIDAPLHPSMASALLATVQKTFVDKHKLKVLLATHSPSTVALAPEDAIFVMDAATRKLAKVSQDRAIATLVQGVPTLSVRIENRRQVFVESEIDQKVWQKIDALVRESLQTDISLEFIRLREKKLDSAQDGARDMGGCSVIRHVVSELRRQGNQSVFGLVDWDAKNSAEDGIVVIGEGARYTLENYLLDPLALAALLLRRRIVPASYFGIDGEAPQTLLAQLAEPELQKAVDKILDRIGWGEDRDDRVSCRYFSGKSVLIPKSYLQKPGHLLESYVLGKLEELKDLRRHPKFKDAIVDEVFGDCSKLMSMDLVEALRSIRSHNKSTSSPKPDEQAQHAVE